MTAPARTWLLPALVALGVSAVAFQAHATSGVQAAAADACTSPGRLPLALRPTMPPRFQFDKLSFPAAQTTADCLALQQFIYMNWPALPAPQYGMPDPNATFGAGNAVRTVWMSYHRVSEIFVANPQPAQRASAVVLRFTNEVLGNTVEVAGIQQATGGWIAGRRPVKSTDGKLTYSPLTFYDVWVNRDEQDYTWSQQLQFAVAQNACAANTGGFRLPTGANDVDCGGHPAHYGVGVGAVEIKAALLDLGPAPLRADGSLDAAKASRAFPTFLLFPTPVELDYPPDDKVGSQPIGVQRNRLVGLVGMHILRKLPGARQFVWSTFEHRDNAPSRGETPPPNGWTFNSTPSPGPTRHPNHNPSPCPSTGCDYGPSQIVRTTPLDAVALAANRSFLALPGLPMNSVFRNYELVQVQWPQVDFEAPPGSGVPLLTDFFQPTRHVANTTLETFAQRMSCVMCHSYGGVASTSTAQRPGRHVFHVADRLSGPPLARLRALISKSTSHGTAPEPPGPPYASDFSFLFGDYGLPGTPPPPKATK